MAVQSKRTMLVQNLFSYAVLLVFSVVALFPIWQVVNISLRPGNQLLSTTLELLPTGATLESYVKLFTHRDFLLWMRNSAIVALAVTVTGVFFASTAGYGFSPFKFF